MTTQLWEIGLVSISTLIGALAPIMLKKGVNTIKSINFNILFNWYLYLGIFLYGLTYVISIPAFKGGDVSILYPFVSLTYVWVAFYGMYFLHEKVDLIKWIGISLIILGLFFTGLGA